MERRLKERLIGAAVLVLAAVIFIPMVLDNSIQDENEITGTNIPERPMSELDNQIQPVKESDLKDIPPLLAEEAGVETVKSNDDEPVKNTSAITPETVIENVPVATHRTNGSSEKTKVESAPSKPSDSEQMETVKKGLTAWVVQLGSFSSEENANGLTEKLRNAGYAAFVEPVKSGSQTVYRVRVGPELLRSDAQALQKKLGEDFQQEGLVLSYP